MRSRPSFVSRSSFGDTVIILLLAAQAADGVMTYVGVTTMGMHMEANPLLLSLMAAFGEGAAVASAKLFAAGLAIPLHLVGVHRVVALLVVVYLLGAVMPWAGLLLFS